jgi:hypothetical protein
LSRVKKVISYIFIVLGLAALSAASYPPLVKRIWEYDKLHAKENKWYFRYISPWGDLVHRTNLDGISKFREEKNYTYERAPGVNKQNVALFVYGDSYTRDIPDSVFRNAGAYAHARITGRFSFRPVAGKQNVLVLEMTERHIRSILHSIEDFSQAPPPSCFDAGSNDGRINYSGFVNKNLDYLLLNYNCLNDIWFAKARMNYRLFDRVSNIAAVSDDGKYLFMRTTVEAKGIYSSYEPLYDTEVQFLARKLNRIYDGFRSAGFDRVYLSLIPSPASILQPARYNRLIPSLQQFPGMKMGIIDVYTPFITDADPASFYRLGDTHWNNKGMHLWIDLVNKEL